MEHIQPRTVGQESTNESSVTKQNTQMPDVQNRAGNETGVSPESEWQASAGESAPMAPTVYLNIDYSTENRSAKFKNGEGGPAQDVPAAGRNQYQ